MQSRQALAPLLGNPTGRVFGGRSGWRVGTPSSVVSVNSTTWNLNPCSAMIEPAAVSYQGMYAWGTDATISGSLTAADSNNPRVDILYIQINDSSAGDGSGALSGPVTYLAGQAAATPAAQPLPPRSFLVATINVPKAGAGAPTVTFNRQYAVAAGAPVPVASQAERDALTQFNGLQVLRTDLPGTPTQTSDGAAWWPQQLAPLSPTGWAVSGWLDVIPVGAYKRVIGNLHINRTGGAFSATAGSYTQIGGSGASLMPAAALSSNGTSSYSSGMQIDVSNGIVNHKGILFVNGSSGAVSFNPDSSFTWNANAFIDVNVSYTI
jgi:hypothetical protein